MSTSKTCVTAALAVVLLVVSAASAQGTSRRFSDPMTFDGMRKLLEPLGLSDAQLAVADRAHATYLRKRMDVRRRRIADYLERYGSTPLSFLDDRSQIVKATAMHKSIAATHRALEDQFFAELMPVLAETQAAGLPRLAMRRERTRLSTRSHAPLIGGRGLPRLSRLDLIRYLDDLELEPALAGKIDTMVAAYESRLTPLYRAVHGHRLDLPLAYFDHTVVTRRASEDRLEQLKSGFDLETPEGREAYAKAVGEHLAEDPPVMPFQVELKELAEIRAQIARISRLNRGLIDDVRPVLGDELADRLQQTYVRRALGAVGIPHDPLRGRVQRFVARGGDPDLRRAVENLYEQYASARRPKVWRLVRAAEEASFERGDEADDVSDARTSIREHDRQALDTYAALTGEEVPEHTDIASLFDAGWTTSEPITLEVHGGEGGDVGGVFAVTVSAEPSELVVLDAPAALEFHAIVEAPVDGGEVATLVFEAVGDGGDHLFPGIAAAMMVTHRGWLPGRIRRDVVDELADELGLDESMRGVVDWLYDDYQTAFGALDQQLLAPAREGVSGHGDASRGEVDERFAAVRVAMEALLALDRSFFDDLEAIRSGSDETAVERAMRSRLREAFGHVGRTSRYLMTPTTSLEHSTDLLAVARKAWPDLDETIPAFAAHDDASAPLFAARWHSRLDAAAEAARKLAELSGGGESVVFDSSTFSDGEHPSEASIRDLNRSTLGLLEPTLDPVDFAAGRQAYRKAAFPSVYRDRAAVEPLLNRAAGLDLPAHVRQRLDELGVGHRQAYDAICDRMVEKIRAFEGAAADRGQALRQELSPDRFERKNLNQRTRQTLIDLLDDDQRFRIGLTD